MNICPEDNENEKWDQFLDALPQEFTKLDELERQVSLGIYHQLAKGFPVETKVLAKRLNIPNEDIEHVIDQWPGVYRDERQRIIGYWGLALSEMPHRMTIGDQTLFAWCAWDSLFIPPLLERTVHVSSRCAVTQKPIEITVTPTGIVHKEPETTVMSYIETKGKHIDKDIINQFCHYLLFFHSVEVSSTWMDLHPGSFLMTVEDGFALGQRKNQRQYSTKLER